MDTPLETANVGPAVASMAEAERRTGIAKDTLRAWERRYGFPAPLRDPHGNRVYPLDQVEKLRLIRILIDHGVRPSKLVQLDLAALHARLSVPAAVQDEGSTWTGEALGLLRSRDVDGLRAHMIGALYAHGLERFVLDNIAPLAVLVGDEWVAGRLEVFEEHLFTEMTVRVLRGALERVSGASGRGPRILLTTLPGEPHVLGLLMAECMMRLDGAACLPLGVETPSQDIVRAAAAHNADVVALSFSAMFGAAAARRDLALLRQSLPERVELWAGGACSGLRAFALPGLHILPGLAAIRGAVGG